MLVLLLCFILCPIVMVSSVTSFKGPTAPVRVALKAVDVTGRELSGRLIAQQVPGDGSCLFHAIATSLRKVAEQDGNSQSDARIADMLRKKAVDILRVGSNLLGVSPGYPRMRAQQLVDAAATELGVDPRKYCEIMQRRGTWGGGPEIVALCNYLRLPIHVYGLKARRRWNKNEFVLLPFARFDARADAATASGDIDGGMIEPDGDVDFNAINILNCDGRFPHSLRPGQERNPPDHFMALLPAPTSTADDDAPSRRLYNVLLSLLSTIHHSAEHSDRDRQHTIKVGGNEGPRNRARAVLSNMMMEALLMEREMTKSGSRPGG